MKAAAFNYHAPASIDEALRLLEVHGEDARILAGGQSLVPTMAFRLAQPGHVIDINRIPQAERPSVAGGRLKIPPLMRHIDFESAPVEGPLGTLLAQVARHISHLPIRLRGTFCGALAQGDPAAEWCLASVVLGAEMMVRSSARGVRAIPAAAFFEGMMTTALADDEMLIEVQIPMLPVYARTGFHEYARRTGDFALAMALAVYDRDEDDMINVRLGVGAVEATARRLHEVEQLMERKVPTKRLFKEAGEAAADLIDPVADIHADGPYRRDLTRAVVIKALESTLA